MALVGRVGRHLHRRCHHGRRLCLLHQPLQHHPGRRLWRQHRAPQSFPFHPGRYIRLLLRRPAAHHQCAGAWSEVGQPHHCGSVVYAPCHERDVVPGLSRSGSTRSTRPRLAVWRHPRHVPSPAARHVDGSRRDWHRLRHCGDEQGHYRRLGYRGDDYSEISEDTVLQRSADCRWHCGALRSDSHRLRCGHRRACWQGELPAVVLFAHRHLRVVASHRPCDCR